MGILQKAENTMAYFKCGIFGFQGSGKTFTATQIGIGICKAVDNPSMAFFATEPGHNFLLSAIREEGIDVFDVKSRSFDDLLVTINECQQEGIAVLIVDSITHVWQELKDAYMTKTQRKKLEFQDWGRIKGKGGWLDYADLFNNSSVHIIASGRAGYDYDFSYNEDGSKDLVKTGTKMKAEAEFGFEPSLVIEMERLTRADIDLEEVSQIKNIKERRKAKQSITVSPGSQFIHRMNILKDRANLLNGQHFDFTGNVGWQDIFPCVEPHLRTLNIGGKHEGVDTTRTSEQRFDRGGNTEWKREETAKQIALEEITAEVRKHIPGRTDEATNAKTYLSEFVFGTSSSKALEGFSSQLLRQGLERIKVIFTVPENTIENIAGGKIIEPPADDVPDFEQGELIK